MKAGDIGAKRRKHGVQNSKPYRKKPITKDAITILEVRSTYQYIPESVASEETPVLWTVLTGEQTM